MKYKASLNPNGQGMLQFKVQPEIDLEGTRTGYFTHHFSDQIARHGNFDLLIELYDVSDVHKLPGLAGRAIGKAYKEILNEKKLSSCAGCIWPFEGSVGIQVIDTTKEPGCKLETDISSKHAAMQKLVQEFFGGFAEDAGVFLTGLGMSIKSPFYICAGLNKENLPLPPDYSPHHQGEALSKATARSMDDLINPQLELIKEDPHRKAYETRKTKETAISCDLDLDGEGKSDIKVETRVDPSKVIPSFTNYLAIFSKYWKCDLSIDATKLGDEPHHACEDIGIVLGRTLNNAMGQKVGIRRLDWCMAENDNIASAVSVDISGRGDCNLILDDKLYENLELYELTNHFLKAFTDHSMIDIFGYVVSKKDSPLYHTLKSTIEEDVLPKLYKSYGLSKFPKGYGEDPSLLLFAELGETLGEAVKIDSRRKGMVPSTKEVLETRK